MNRITATFGMALVLALAGGMVLAGDNAGSDKMVRADSNGSSSEMVTKGKALYAQHCLHCHGLNMVNPGTYSYDLRQFPHDEKPRFVNSVTHGKNNRMPAWGDVLKPEEIEELWAYVESGGKG